MFSSATSVARWSAAFVLGIEAAYGLARAGVRVTLVHLMDRLMERQLDAPAAALLCRALKAKGIDVVLNADTTGLDGLIKGNVADVIVTDLPYGVAHGSYDEDGGGISRRPLDLLERAVPQWLQLLRPGGAIGISWNTKVAKRELAEDILAAGEALQTAGVIAADVDVAAQVDALLDPRLTAQLAAN